PATEAARRYALFHAGVGRLHCAEEETVVAPFLPAALRDRMLREHAELERLAHGLPATQAELGERLRAHVRFEEDEAFAALQLLPESELVRLGALSREVRSKTRSPGEACHLT
ncbi:MAG: hypothetical protein QOI63_1490, partial [Thermoplasmata archaeon]|nr:hypothetical protein [Thermoplasmata archaeon]